ncbi:hypothetical protein R5R35_009277 [Gryllus longicercus]|uniref:Meckelin n=1 Tax=Gryllus longicercus TaxID=2509291 RepID=A0AAN9WSW9_9ORTH
MPDGICVSSEILADWPDERSSYTIEYKSGVKVISAFFRRHLLSAIFKCKLRNLVACQMVANMCTMLLFDDYSEGSPCKLFLDPKRMLTHNNIPSLFYREGEALTVLNRKKIPTKYSLSSTSSVNRLNLTVSRFSPSGQFKGFAVATGSFLQLCPESWEVLDAGLRFGSRYHRKCTIPIQQLLNHQTEFFDLSLQYEEGGESKFHSIPILTQNMKTKSISYNNEASDPSQWLLTKRFFLVDKVSGVQTVWVDGNDQEALPSVVRYLKSCEVRVRLRSAEDEGLIYSPLLVVHYGEVTQTEIEANSHVDISFSTSYDMPNNFDYALEVSMGVLCSLSVVWSGIETWSYSRRSGRVGIDLFTIAELALFSCGNLANVFFLVVACASLHTFFFYKGESVIHLLLLSSSNENLIKTYVIVAFALKIIEIVFMIWKQISIDIFFIDWERPRALNSGNGNAQTLIDHNDGMEHPVSIWRTYLVANEWNEMQTKRKISLLFQLVFTVFILKVVGVEHWAVADPDVSTSVPTYMNDSPPCASFRFAIAVLVFVIVYILQRLYVVMLHERYIRNGIQQFVDLCAMANISVFVLSLENFGYYIHGRSAHGFADTDMQTILFQLQREEEDLCGHRGLLPGTDHQTFEMIIPLQLRSYYRKVMAPISSTSIVQSTKRLSSAGAGSLRSKMSSTNVDRSVQAYHTMNKFLAAFLEHALVDLDYEVKEKSMSESLLDIEFSESLDKGVFFVDNGHSFDKILFYGNEFTLTTFDLMLFSFIEILTQDYLLAAILTGAISQILVTVRIIGGKRNLARKTLIDERFLI